MNLVFTVPIKLGRGQNDRNAHWAIKARRVAAERKAVWAGFPRRKLPEAIPLPIYVRLTRIAPGTTPMDFDNVVGSLKGVRDAVAKELRVDDGDESRIRFIYRQERGPWAVRVELKDMDTHYEEEFGMGMRKPEPQDGPGLHRVLKMGDPK